MTAKTNAMMGATVPVIGWTKMDASATSGGGFTIPKRIRHGHVRAAERVAWRAEADEALLARDEPEDEDLDALDFTWGFLGDVIDDEPDVAPDTGWCGCFCRRCVLHDDCGAAASPVTRTRRSDDVRRLRSLHNRLHPQLRRLLHPH